MDVAVSAIICICATLNHISHIYVGVSSSWEPGDGGREGFKLSRVGKLKEGSSEENALAWIRLNVYP